MVNDPRCLTRYLDTSTLTPDATLHELQSAARTRYHGFATLPPSTLDQCQSAARTRYHDFATIPRNATSVGTSSTASTSSSRQNNVPGPTPRRQR
jgi:hypothetical protein